MRLENGVNLCPFTCIFMFLHTAATYLMQMLRQSLWICGPTLPRVLSEAVKNVRWQQQLGRVNGASWVSKDLSSYWLYIGPTSTEPMALHSLPRPCGTFYLALFATHNTNHMITEEGAENFTPSSKQQSNTQSQSWLFCFATVTVKLGFFIPRNNSMYTLFIKNYLHYQI